MPDVRTFSYGICSANCYLICSSDRKKGVLIDPSAPPSVVLRGLPPSFTLCFILLTHHHYDHLVHLQTWLDAYPVPLAVGAADAAGLTDSRLNLSERIAGQAISFPAADMRLSDDTKLPYFDGDIRVIATPGHTPGSVCYLFGETLFSGDTVFSDGGVGRTDFPGGSLTDLKRSLTRILSLPPQTVIYPGHGGPTTVHSERAIHFYGGT